VNIEDIRAETATAARPAENIVANIAAQIKAGKGAAPKP
jgi:hypothetical protein